MKRTVSISASLAILTLSLSSASADGPRARDTEVNWAIPNVLPDATGRIAAPTPAPPTYVEIPAVPVVHPPVVVRQRVEIYGAPRHDIAPASVVTTTAPQNLMGAVVTTPTPTSIELSGEARANEPAVAPPSEAVSVEVEPLTAREPSAAPAAVPQAPAPTATPATTPAARANAAAEPAAVSSLEPVFMTPRPGRARITSLTTAPPPESLTRIETPRHIENDGVVDTRLPRGRAIANLSGDACMELLRERHIPFEEVDAQSAEGVRTPIRVQGPLAGIEIAPREDNDRLHAVMDCRMAVAVLAWAPALRAAGVRRIEHYSIYRPHAVVAGTDTRSGHANALALDSAVYYFDDGTHADILHEWGDRTHGEDPCGEYEGETDHARSMRRVVCSAIRDEIFEIVLTPHYDRAHQNHVHLELRPNVNWAFIH